MVFFIKPATRRKTAFVIEFKVADKISQLEAKAQEALNQIKDRQYVKELNDDGYEDVVKYGVAFFRKDCVIKVEE
jgi:hypothetical protein